MGVLEWVGAGEYDATYFTMYKLDPECNGVAEGVQGRKSGVLNEGKATQG